MFPPFVLSTYGWACCLGQGFQSSSCCHCFCIATHSTSQSIPPCTPLNANPGSTAVPYTSIFPLSKAFPGHGSCHAQYLSALCSTWQLVQITFSFSAVFKLLQMKPLHIPVGDQYHSHELSYLMWHSLRNIGTKTSSLLQVPCGPSFGLGHLKNPLKVL